MGENMREYCDALGSDECSAPGFYRETKVKKCQRDYRCSACGEKIATGGPCVVVVGSWDGDVRAFRLHQNCLAVLNEAGKFYGSGFFLECNLGGCIEGWYNDARTTEKGNQLAKAIDDFSAGGVE